MAALSRAKSKAMYSWWWDSHISPKNSKWLKENLTDMDSKVKTMIKLIEVDEDSFVRRAEVYFKRRPELMKLVEEFYRAYRALAERYDHATGVIRHAHKTMSEAFPDQVPSLMNDDGPINIILEGDETRSSRQSSPEPDEMSASRNGDFTDESDKLAARKGSRQLNGLEKARKELNFQDPKPDSDIQALREAIAKLEVEKEAGLARYRETLERLAELETEVCEAKEDSRGLYERACKAEAEVESLKETLVSVEAQREGYLLQYQQCLARIADLEGRISCSEQDSEALKEEIARVKAEKETLLGKYLESLEKIANLENKLLLAKDYAERAEKEIEALKETIDILTEEKEAAVCKYEECLEKIAELERRIAAIEEEAERSNKSLRSEVDSLVQKVGVQDQELSEKQKELGRLWTCVQEERMRFMEAENAFQSLHNMHSKVQEELRSVAGELQKNVQLLKDMEVRSQNLEDEVHKAKDENKGLQDDIFGLKDEKGKLKEELELRIDQRNALQQEIYSLKEELNGLTQRHQDAVAYANGLREENSKLEERCRGNEFEIASLVEKLSVMEKLIEKNELLENSLGNLQGELDEAREKVKALEESCQLLMGEKSSLVSDKAVLISQLQITTENLEKLAERNSFLENSLFDANVELEMLRVKSKNLEDSCKLLNDQNSVLVTEKQTLTAQLETTQQKLDDLGKRHADLEQRFTGLEEERESTLKRVEELQGCLEVEKQEHDSSNQLNGKKIADLESQICVLQEAGHQMRQEFEEELDKAVNAQFDIFILRKCIQELKDKNTSLMGYCEKLLEASRLSEKLISELEHAGHEKQEGLRALSVEVKGLRRGMFELLEAIQSDHAGLEYNNVGYANDDQRILHYILGKLDDIKASLSEALDENQALVVEKSVLLAILWQLKKDVDDLNAVIIILKQDIGTRNDQIVALQKEMQQLWENNEELVLKVREGNQKEAALLIEMEILRKKLFDLQGAYDDLQEEKCKVAEDRDSLRRAYGVLQEEKDDLEHECSCMVEEAVSLDNLSFVFKNVMSEKARQVLELSENVDRLGYDNGQLMEKMRTTESKLEEILAKNIGLEALLKEAENELSELRAANDELKVEMANEKETLRAKETEHMRECKDLYDTIESLESQVSKISKEYGTLSSELEKGKDAVELWETVACTFFAELQSACVREAMIKEKFYELIKEYEVIEEESRSKGADTVQLQERVGVLEGENSEIKARLAADFAAIMSLRDSVASLEKHTTTHRKLGKTGDEENQEVTTATTTQLGEHVDLHDVQGRIRAVEKAVIELKKRSEEQHSSLRNDLELAMRKILKLKSPSGSRNGSKRFSKRFAPNLEEGPQIPEDEILMKDIVLDRVSSGNLSSDGLMKGRRKTPSNDDQGFEFWESMEKQGGHVDITTVNKSGRENRSSRPSSELTVEKELLFVDDGDSQKPYHHREEDESRRKFLERLVSDVEKLNSLQVTVHDLMDRAENSSECENVRDQLAEKEKAIQRLIEFGGKLVKKVEKAPSFDDSATSTASITTADSVSETGSGRRRSCKEQARRMSEKIGRLQHEVQKIQFDLVMKLDNINNKKGKKGGTRVPEWNSRVRLRDFLYGPAYRTPPKRRFRPRFCGCVRPPSTLDD